LIYLDTHVLAWLYARQLHLFPAGVLEQLESSDDLRVSSMARLELQYLFETGRVTEPAVTVLDALEATLGLDVCAAPFAAVVRGATEQNWTRDPFDRLITAQAALFDAPLLTRDRGIRGHYPHAFWDEPLGGSS